MNTSRGRANSEFVDGAGHGVGGQTGRRVQPASDGEPREPGASRKRLIHLAIVLAGIAIGQFILYGPSLIGSRILLPLDILAQPGVYLPNTAENAGIVPHDPILSDLILQFETERHFVASEMRLGRFPMWLPYQYAGVPLVWPRFSPFLLLACSTPSPFILAWAQFATAVVAGLGMYAFCRRVLKVSFWAACIPAWSYPLTGFFIFWQGFPTCASIYWFPWLLLAVDGASRRPGVWTIAGLSLATGLVLVSGHIDVAGQSLIAAGLYGIWCLADAYRTSRLGSAARRGGAALALGWALGFVLATPHVWPLLEHAGTGARMLDRNAGTEERPPTGFSALPQVVLPDIYGTTRNGSFWLAAGNQVESAAASYAGIMAILFLAPLAWCSRRHRPFLACWLALGVLGLSWCLNLPGIVALLRLPGLNMMSHNRLVFITAFAVLAHAAVGLDVLTKREVRWRAWHWLPAGLLLVLSLWCVQRANSLPEPIATKIGTAVSQGARVGWIGDAAGVQQVQSWFVASYYTSALLCAVGLLAWLLVWRGKFTQAWFVPAVAIAVLADLLWFASGRSPQCDPSLYYPRIPLLQEIAKAPVGRVVGYSCLPATLAQTHGLHDVRGYDSIDPAGMINLLNLAADPRTPHIPYARTQWFIPRIEIRLPDELRLPPVLDMLGVRYVIFRGLAPQGIRPAFVDADYWALVNRSALPRVFIPSRVERIALDDDCLRRIGSTDFDPRAVAFVRESVDVRGEARGAVSIETETPTEISVSAAMETAGLVVLADLWSKGWRAYANGQEVPVLRVNYGLRGVVVGAGTTQIQFRYQPRSFTISLWLAGIVAMTLVTALAADAGRRRVSSRS